MNSLKELFGDIDIYLFDQLLKGRFDRCGRILDAGCGTGRNLVWFLRNHFEVYGVDQDEGSIALLRKLAATLAPHLPATNFQQSLVEDLLFEANSFDLVISSAVLHFARDQDHFDRMLHSMWRVLKPGGYLFIRLASLIGLEDRVLPLGQGRYHLPDGSDRFLVDEPMLLDYTRQLGGSLFEPIKTTQVQHQRCMTTWCLRKSS